MTLLLDIHIHYRTVSPLTGSTGSPGRWIPGSLGRRVTKCDPVPCLARTSLTLVSLRRRVRRGGTRVLLKATDIVSGSRPTLVVRIVTSHDHSSPSTTASTHSVSLSSSVAWLVILRISYERFIFFNYAQIT